MMRAVCSLLAFISILTHSGLFLHAFELIDLPEGDLTSHFPLLSSANSTRTSRHLQAKTTLSVIQGQSDLSTFANAIRVGNLQNALSQTGSFTTFAPTNEAFSFISQAYLKTLLTAPWILHLQELVIYHVNIARALFKNNFSNGMIITMINLENATISVTKNPFNIQINSLYTKGSNLIQFDFAASNGVVHKVNKVLIPTFYRTNLMRLITRFNDFTTMVSLLQTAGLAKTVREGTAITVLAPTNKAWQALGQQKLNALKKNVKELRRVLRYHILPIVLPTLQFKKGAQYRTLQGSNVTFTFRDSNTLLFNDAKIITVNALARNGIGHAIDKVLTVP
jgi:uncharacterized surface protein with fasciclin (FAS1) repeats